MDGIRYDYASFPNLDSKYAFQHLITQWVSVVILSMVDTSVKDTEVINSKRFLPISW